MKSITPNDFFKTLSDENRLRIIRLLAKRNELCVCDIMSVLRMGQSKVSRHLAYLRKAGLVAGRKDGLWSHYSLAKPESGAHRRILECVSGCFNEVPALKNDLSRLKNLKLSGSCR